MAQKNDVIYEVLFEELYPSVTASALETAATKVRTALAERLDREAVGFKKDGGGFNQRDKDRLWGLNSVLSWLRGEEPAPIAAPHSS